MKVLIFITLLISTLTLADDEVRKAELDKEKAACQSFDNRKNFPFIRDQNGHGLCWAFVGAALLEEQLCVNETGLCLNSLSVIDGHRCYWDKEKGMATKTEAGYIHSYMECALKGGVCNEALAPYKTNANTFNAITNTAALQKAFHRIRREYKSNGNCLLEGKTVLPEKLEGLSSNANKAYRFLLDNYPHMAYLKIDLHDALINSKDSKEFLQKFLIPPTCRENRIDLPRGLETVHESFADNASYIKKLESINKIAQETGHSIGLGICATRIMNSLAYKDQDFIYKYLNTKQEHLDYLYSKKCGGHAVVVNAMEYKNGRCMVHVRNSWGEDSELSGWVDAEHVLDHTITTDYIKKK